MTEGISDAADRKKIFDAINQLMYDVGSPIPGHAARQICVEFRPAVSSDTEVVRIQYGQGCSAAVSDRAEFDAVLFASIQVGYFPNFAKKLTLQSVSCFHQGIIQHELLHVLGKLPWIERFRFICTALSFRFLPRTVATRSRFLHHGAQ